MEARVLSLEYVLGERQRWVVPVYQRHYSWQSSGLDSQLPRFWEDVRSKAEERLAGSSVYPHYIGALLVAEPPSQTFGVVRQSLLVDGQQRMTTFQLLCAAVREVARRHGLTQFEASINTCIFNERSGGMAKPDEEVYKLWPSSYDREIFRAIVDLDLAGIRKRFSDLFFKNGNIKSTSRQLLLAAYCFLIESIEEFVTDAGEGPEIERRIEAIMHGFLKGFRVVVILLDKTDDAQEIFASLNGLGKPLTPFDLIRNDIFHRARVKEESEEALFEGQWKTFEDPWWEEVTRQGRFKKARIDFFLGHMLVAETAREVNLTKLAVQYQAYARARTFPAIADELEHIIRYVAPYKTLVNRKGEHCSADIAVFLAAWDQTTFFPLVLFVAVQEIDDDDKREIFRMVESYLVRRDLCGWGSKANNTTVLRLLNRLQGKALTPAAFAEALRSLDGESAKLPSDAEVLTLLPRRALYIDLPTPRLRYILQALENASRTSFDDTVMTTQAPTIEHVMPQRWAAAWPLPDGTMSPTEASITARFTLKLPEPICELIAVRERLINTIGNLTLVTASLNPSLSNGPFAAKKAQFARSLLAMNRGIAEVEDWTEKRIEKRGRDLSELANQIWAVPYLA